MIEYLSLIAGGANTGMAIADIPGPNVTIARDCDFSRLPTLAHKRPSPHLVRSFARWPDPGQNHREMLLPYVLRDVIEVRLTALRPGALSQLIRESPSQVQQR